MGHDIGLGRTIRGANGITHSKHPPPHFFQALGAVFDPPLRSELVTVVAKDSCVSVEDPGVHTNRRPRWDELPVKDHSACWYISFEHETCAGMDPECLYDDRITVFGD